MISLALNPRWAGTKTPFASMHLLAGVAFTVGPLLVTPPSQHGGEQSLILFYLTNAGTSAICL
jgi:hypothetical protein